MNERRVGWHVEAHGWYTSEGKSPLGKEERVGYVYSPQKDIETHKEANCCANTCEWSPTSNNNKKNV